MTATAWQWENAGDTAMRCGPWTICSIKLNGQEVFELWHDKRPARLGAFGSAGEAGKEAKRLAEEGMA